MSCSYLVNLTGSFVQDVLLAAIEGAKPKNGSNEADMNKGLNRINIILENEIRPDIKLLDENYLPAATRYER